MNISKYKGHIKSFNLVVVMQKDVLYSTAVKESQLNCYFFSMTNTY